MNAKLQASLRECALHADILRQGLNDIANSLPFTAAMLASLNPAQRRILDQLAYRFTKLQDSLGEKVFPGILELSAEPLPDHATFMEKLHRLERLQAIPSVDTWKTLRELRNAIAHEYPDALEIQAARLNQFAAGIATLLSCWDAVQRFVAKVDAVTNTFWDEKKAF